MVTCPLTMANQRGKIMKVKTYVINRGTKSQYFGLIAIDKDGQEWVVYHAPNNWKTEKGALNWAKKRGYEIA